MPTFLQTHISIPLTEQDRLSRGALKLTMCCNEIFFLVNPTLLTNRLIPTTLAD